MILHAEHAEFAVTQAFDGVVVEVDVRDLAALQIAVRCYSEAVIMGADFYCASKQVFDGLVATAMSEAHLLSFAAQRQRHNLMPKANSKDRDFAEQILRVVNHVIHCRRIAGTIAQEHPRWLQSEHSFCRHLC